MTNTSVKKYESPVRENGDHNEKVPLTSFMTPPSDLTKLDLQEEEKAVTPSGDQSPGTPIDDDDDWMVIHALLFPF